MKPEHMKKISDFTDTFEAAIIGLQIMDAELPTITAGQYAVALAAGLHGMITALAGSGLVPEPDDQADYAGYISEAAEHYAERMSQTAIELSQKFIDSMSNLES